MFREMRRKNQALSPEICVEILKNGKTGTMAVLGDDDYPYSVPLNYVYFNNKIYFHGAKSGHKVDAIKKHDKVSFSVVEKDEVVPHLFGTDYKSVIAFGRARILDENEIMPLIKILTKKYCPNIDDDKIQSEIDRDFSRLLMVEIEIEHLTGKQAIDFIRNHKKPV